MSRDELIRTAAVIAQRDDVSQVTIVTTTDDGGTWAELTAWQCSNPDCRKIHIQEQATLDRRFQWDEEECAAVPVAISEEDED